MGRAGDSLREAQAKGKVGAPDANGQLEPECQALAPQPVAKAGRDRPSKGWKRRAEALKRAVKGAEA